MPNQVVVDLLQPLVYQDRPYHAGERVGLPPDLAATLIRDGKAVAVAPVA